MASPFLGEIRMVGFNFAPYGWALCNGQLMSIQQNTALFSLLGTFYGGNGTSTFALPNLQGYVPIHQGQARSGTIYTIGEISGTESITLLQNDLPAHNHGGAFQTAAGGSRGNVKSPAGHVLAGHETVNVWNPASNTQMAPLIYGQNLPHENRQPFLVVNFVIALNGIFPSRN